MAIKEEVRGSSIYIKIKRGKDSAGKDIILKAFKLPVATTITDVQAMSILTKVQELTNYPVVSANQDVITEITETLP